MSGMGKYTMFINEMIQCFRDSSSHQINLSKFKKFFFQNPNMSFKIKLENQIEILPKESAKASNILLNNKAYYKGRL